MAVNSYALTNLARFKTFLGISGTAHDTLLERIINTTTDYIENYCDRRFQLTTYTNEVYDGTNYPEILLDNYPIVTFTTLENRDSVNNVNSWSAIDSENYFVKYDEGIIVLAEDKFENLAQYYRVTYSAGFAIDVTNVVPVTLEAVFHTDLEYACWKIGGKFYNQRKLSDNISSERIGEYAVTFRKELALDPEIQQILEQYRRPTYGL